MTVPIAQQIPDDFVEVAQGKTILQLSKIYHRSQSTIVAWRRAKGIAGLTPPPPPRAVNRPVPVGFAAAARTMTRNGLRVRFRAGLPLIDRWCKQEGVTPLPAAAHWRQPKHAPNVDYRENSQAGKAAQFLQKFGPVVRCDENGRLEGNHTHWLRGGRTILTDAEIIERAVRNGYDPLAWTRIAAA